MGILAQLWLQLKESHGTGHFGSRRSGRCSGRRLLHCWSWQDLGRSYWGTHWAECSALGFLSCRLQSTPYPHDPSSPLMSPHLCKVSPCGHLRPRCGSRHGSITSLQAPKSQKFWSKGSYFCSSLLALYKNLIFILSHLLVKGIILISERLKVIYHLWLLTYLLQRYIFWHLSLTYF